MNMLELDWERLRLAEPYWLWLLLLIPLFLFLRHHFRAKRTPTLVFSSLTFPKAARPKSPRLLRALPPALRSLAFGSIVLALARPQLDESTHTVEASGVDIVLAVDLSGSMLALDMSENPRSPITRLDVVKRVLEEFVDKRRHDRLGLVAFATNPYLLSPLTLDKEHLHRNLDRLRVGLTGQTGTSIGDALAEGINRVRKLEAETRIVILLTDGMDDPPPRHSPIVYAEGAKKDGIKVYTIAVGRSTHTSSYVYHPRTGDLRRYADGSPVVNPRAVYPVDKEILRKIAETTGAVFYEAGNEQDLRNIYNEIDRLEKTEVEYQVNALYEELFFLPALAGLLILLVETVLARTVLSRVP